MHDVIPGPVLSMDMGDHRIERAHSEMGRLPTSVALEGIRISIQEGQATHAHDRDNILRLISGSTDALIPVQCPEYDRMNLTVRRVFCGSALRSMGVAGDVAGITEALAWGPDLIDQPNQDGFTPLFGACCRGHSEAVRVLIEAGANLDRCTATGCTPLLDVAAHGHFEIAELLIQAGADLESQDNDGWTALSQAVQNGHYDVARVLLDAGADLNSADHLGRTALLRAAYRGDAEMISLLARQGASLDHRASEGWTALLVAIADGHTEALQCLLSANADVNMATASGIAPVALAVFEQHADMVDSLLEAKASPFSVPGNADGLLRRGVRIDLTNPEAVGFVKRAVAMQDQGVLEMIAQNDPNSEANELEHQMGLAPEEVLVGAFHRHTLRKTRTPLLGSAYERGYGCDICQRAQLTQGWLYHCGVCDWDAHPQCLLGTAAPLEEEI
eukprot:TRINITY_DN9847_c0_g2_i2.p1 TRINITY_DN9847_c0_g2~~TRINITY_DN9847_c0_g2_i2.p1  ORF type:complete len:446 (-),score=64.78 TRINITY_DN9847_c0_g2_i2:695-2032(-)